VKLSISDGGVVSLESAVVSLEGIVPVINGTILENAQLTWDQAGLHYNLPALENGSFHVEIVQETPEHCWLSYWLESLPDDFVLDSFGIRFEKLSNLRAFLRNGYFSWDGSFYVEPEHIDSPAPTPFLEQGYAMTQLLPHSGTGSVIIGFDRHDRYQHTFKLDRQVSPFALTIETLWDRAERDEFNRTTSERLVIFEHEAVEDALREWAKIVAAASPIAPRLSTKPISGWCSWYNLYAYINEANILEHLHSTAEVVRRENLPMWVFQIDDGFTPEMGDWLDVKPQFPRGMKPLLDDIRAEGFTPGLWIAPFMVGNRSSLYAQHPDWVVKERHTGQPLAHMRFYAEFRWHKRSEEYYILDATHPEAFDYLRLVFRTWRHEWGCEYFKTDFMHFGSEYGPDRAVWHQSSLSRIQIWRKVAEMIREEIGDVVWLGCGCPLWASVGLVDAVRIGRDVGVKWSGNQSAQSLLRDQATRNFANHILWQADPDCILLRERFHDLTSDEVQSLALYAGMSSGLVMTSDMLYDLSEERLILWKLLLNPEKSLCRFPLLGTTALAHRLNPAGQVETCALDPVLVQIRTALEENDLAAVFILNTSENAIQRSYDLEQFGLASNCYRFDWNSSHLYPMPIDKVALTLQPHASELIFLSRKNVHIRPSHLP
jgi:alpha-galactosidase